MDFLIKKMNFSADQVYGDQDMHSVVRKMCMDYMVNEKLNLFLKLIGFFYRKKTVIIFLST